MAGSRPNATREHQLLKAAASARGPVAWRDVVADVSEPAAIKALERASRTLERKGLIQRLWDGRKLAGYKLTKAGARDHAARTRGERRKRAASTPEPLAPLQKHRTAMRHLREQDIAFLTLLERALLPWPYQPRLMAPGDYTDAEPDAVILEAARRYYLESRDTLYLNKEMRSELGDLPAPSEAAAWLRARRTKSA